MFRPLTQDIMVSPQIGIDAVAEAKALGVSLIINNRARILRPRRVPPGLSMWRSPSPIAALANPKWPRWQRR